MFNDYKDTIDIERDYCDKILDQCSQKGLEIMNINVTDNMYSIWFNYTVDTLKEVAQKTGDYSIVTEFENTKLINKQYIFERVNESLRSLNTIRGKVFRNYMKNKFDELHKNNANSSPSAFIPSYNYSSYANPYLTPNEQELKYLQLKNNQSQYNNYYDNMESVLKNTENTKDGTVLSILNATGNHYTKQSLLTLPIGVVKMMADISVEFVVSKLKEEYPNNATAHLVIDGLKELTKQKIKAIIDDWYINKRY